MEESNTTGNYGLLDQLEAMSWVKQNIQSFGGDPTKITISGYLKWFFHLTFTGESAGAISVMHHLATGDGSLFQGAIMQSSTTYLLYDLSTATMQGDQFVAGVGCSNSADILACVRQVRHHKHIAF